MLRPPSDWVLSPVAAPRPQQFIDIERHMRAEMLRAFVLPPRKVTFSGHPKGGPL